MVAGLGAKVATGDGNRVLECYELIQATVESLRSGQGPWFLEFSTYRWLEHCGHEFDNHLGYRTPEEFEAWKKRDPIPLFETELLEQHPESGVALATMKQEVQQEVLEAFAFAELSPFPPPEEAYLGVYSDYID
jgi:pyruvate dehydrogenase E1 component alpha subunit